MSRRGTNRAWKARLSGRRRRGRTGALRISAFRQVHQRFSAIIFSSEVELGLPYKEKVIAPSAQTKRWSGARPAPAVPARCVFPTDPEGKGTHTRRRGESLSMPLTPEGVSDRTQKSQILRSCRNSLRHLDH